MKKTECCRHDVERGFGGWVMRDVQHSMQCIIQCSNNYPDTGVLPFLAEPLCSQLQGQTGSPQFAAWLHRAVCGCNEPFGSEDYNLVANEKIWIICHCAWFLISSVLLGLLVLKAVPAMFNQMLSVGLLLVFCFLSKLWLYRLTILGAITCAVLVYLSNSNTWVFGFKLISGGGTTVMQF